MPHALFTRLAALLLLASCLSSVTVSQARVAPDRTGPVKELAVTQVVVISIDGLNPKAITRLGSAGVPVLHGLMAEGASTLNARRSAPGDSTWRAGSYPASTASLHPRSGRRSAGYRAA